MTLPNNKPMDREAVLMRLINYKDAWGVAQAKVIMAAMGCAKFNEIPASRYAELSEMLTKFNADQARMNRIAVPDLDLAVVTLEPLVAQPPPPITFITSAPAELPCPSKVTSSMKLSDIVDHCAYEHRHFGPVWVVGRHPHDGAAVIVAKWCDTLDEERYYLTTSEDFVKPLTGDEYKPTHGRALAHFNAPASATGKSEQAITLPQSVIADLIEIARAAHKLTHGGTMQEDEAVVCGVTYSDLADALASLEALPQPEGQTLTGPARAELLLTGMTGVPQVAPGAPAVDLIDFKRTFGIHSYEPDAYEPRGQVLPPNAWSKGKDNARQLNTIITVAYNDKGDMAITSSRSTSDPAGDFHLMESFLELEQAKRLRGVPFKEHKLGVLWLVDDAHLQDLKLWAGEHSFDISAKEGVRELALACGFQLKDMDGVQDLKPYVYKFASAMLMSAAGIGISNFDDMDLTAVSTAYLEQLQNAVADLACDGRRFRALLSMSDLNSERAEAAAQRLYELTEAEGVNIAEREPIPLDVYRKCVDQVIAEGLLVDETAPEKTINSALQAEQLRIDAMQLAHRVADGYRAKETSALDKDYIAYYCNNCGAELTEDSLMEQHGGRCIIPLAKQLIENYEEPQDPSRSEASKGAQGEPQSRFHIGGVVGMKPGEVAVTLQHGRELPPIGQHVLYATDDHDRPDQICDSNGEVVLAQCRRCGMAEIELEQNPVCVAPASKVMG